MRNDLSGVGIAMALALVIEGIINHKWFNVVFFSIIIVDLIGLLILSRKE